MRYFKWVWQFPQHLLALLLLKVLKPTRMVNGNSKIIYWFFVPQGKFSKFISGVSLGQYIILKTHIETTIRHEYGHSVQSLWLGPLYLIFVGIPSAVFNNLWDRWFHKKWDMTKRIQWYYNRWPEKQADKLGGVKRF